MTCGWWSLWWSINQHIQANDAISFEWICWFFFQMALFDCSYELASNDAYILYGNSIEMPRTHTHWKQLIQSAQRKRFMRSIQYIHIKESCVLRSHCSISCQIRFSFASEWLKWVGNFTLNFFLTLLYQNETQRNERHSRIVIICAHVKNIK